MSLYKIPDGLLGDNDAYARWWFEVQRAEWEAEMRQEGNGSDEGHNSSTL